jgi:cellulose synthase/poly-beta-1,6-N-acetylglucosamine synthase-like glycosyltransferase
MTLVVVDGLLTALSAALLVPALVLFAEIVAAMRPRADADGSLAQAEPGAKVVVLMPAHDEAEGIAPVIDAVLAQLGPLDRLLVVADNCSDATASIARAKGAQVIERNDTTQRGKGYALDAGVRWLEREPPDVVVIVDADCLLAPQALGRLVAACRSQARPIQALYLMRAPAGASLGARLAEFAWIVRNQVRPLGALAMGWPCQLMGTGMAFPWPVLRGAPLASAHLVEDMQLGLDLAGAGAAPLFCPEALVTSSFPSAPEGVASQRARWEHGHLSVIATAAPRLLGRAVATGNARLLAMVLDLVVPPLAALVLALGAAIVLDLAAWLAGTGVAPLALAVLALTLLACGVVAAWARHARHVVSLRELLSVPFYVMAKMPLYARVFTRRQVEWVRTKRDGTGR